ncbi:MAG TPA: winged helix-turn-helix domain-containing protein, partial [Vicinamibacterales bacterium]|nr:winged helix-turn-helix domain-containing protein [Vicinamibacterales bacterium]
MTRLRFGPFDVDLNSSEIFKRGRLIRLQHQPFEVLRVLLEHPDELVTRDVLRRRLWPDGVTVDFDQSLNKSITKLREALGDTATSSRFIETVPKRGYRF